MNWLANVVLNAIGWKPPRGCHESRGGWKPTRPPKRFFAPRTKRLIAISDYPPSITSLAAAASGEERLITSVAPRLEIR